MGMQPGFLQYGSLLALCVSGLVLLLASANAANLHAARAARAPRRSAFGWRLARHLLFESA
jgi:hypothetical protein